MARLKIVHELVFEYSKPVYLDPHIFNLQPRSDGAQKVESFQLHVDPAPAGMNTLLDLEGNNSQRAWFTGEHKRLAVSGASIVHTSRANPFDFIADPSFRELPQPYTKTLKEALRPYLSWTPLSSIKNFTAPIVKAAGKNPLDFLYHLTARMNSDFKKIRRESGPAWSAGKTLSMKVGSCRDISSLFSSACRANGLATRFVSGYYMADSESERKDLHAWVEVFIPGAGWRGYDATSGLVVGEMHVTAAASRDFAAISPLIGNYRGNGVTAKLNYSVRIKIDD